NSIPTNAAASFFAIIETIHEAAKIVGLDNNHCEDGVCALGVPGVFPGEPGIAPKSGVTATEPQSRYIPTAVRRAAVEENPTATCVFCKRPGSATTFDHAVPHSRGGSSTDIRNIQRACPHCNSSKGAGVTPKNPPPGY